MKLRLFWTMLIAFVLVIVLGIFGMFASFGVSWVLLGRPEPRTTSFDRTRQAFARSLADYYVANGGSWQGIDQRLSDLTSYGIGMGGVVLLDSSGRVVAADPSLPMGTPLQLTPQQLARSEPVLARGARVGTLLFGFGGQMMGDHEHGGPPAFFWPVLRGALAAGAGLIAVLLGLAIIFAGRISRPVRRLTLAAQDLAAGRLDVQVPGAAVRELDELGVAFNRMARSLADADRQRRQLTADIAHELRTPLSIIKGRLMGVQDGVYEATPDQVTRLLDETALLERLIDDLRLLALAEAGQLPLYLELCSPRDLLADAAAGFADQAAAREVALCVEAPADLPLILADPQRIAQVLANLVTNALRYTPAGGSVTLGAALAQGAAPRQVAVTVADTGSGIAADDLPHVFERFYRADRARSRGAGAGLGLAISRQIILAHGGDICASSTLGAGTTIRVLLPAAQEEALGA